jgi:hypothetical protein
MKVDMTDIPLHLFSPAAVGSALKIYQAGGLKLTEPQMRRVVASNHLFKTYQREILGLVQQLEDATEAGG